MSAYAIGPGLHYWNYEEFERKSIFVPIITTGNPSAARSSRFTD